LNCTFAYVPGLDSWCVALLQLFCVLVVSAVAEAAGERLQLFLAAAW
jgi:hypothetical protein